MPVHVVERAMSVPEREFLQRVLDDAPSDAQRFARGAANAVILWAVCMLIFVVVWLVLAWVVRSLAHVEIGWRSPTALWVLGLGMPACAAIAITSSVRWVRSWFDNRPSLHADLENGQVIEEHYQFTAARRFQEPEHGGLIYFLHTGDDRALTLFDHESQDRGVRGEDPLQSAFQPREKLVMVRGPQSKLVIDKQFAGETLDAGEPVGLSLDPRQWPEADEICAIPWSELQARLH